MLGINRQPRKTARDYDLYAGEKIDLTAQKQNKYYSGINSELVGGDVVSKNTYNQLQAYNQYRDVADSGMTKSTTGIAKKKRPALFGDTDISTIYGN